MNARLLVADGVMGSRREGRGRVSHTFNRRIIFVDKVALDQLDRQTRLSDTTTTDNNELILAQKL